MAEYKNLVKMSRGQFMATLTPEQKTLTVQVHRKSMILKKRTVEDIADIGKDLTRLKKGMDHEKWLLMR